MVDEETIPYDEETPTDETPSNNESSIISIEELKKEYLSEKIITITYEEDIADKEIDFEVMEKIDNRVILKVDNNKISMAEILQKFMKYGNVVDIEAIPVPLEEVIYDIYTRGDET